MTPSHDLVDSPAASPVGAPANPSSTIYRAVLAALLLCLAFFTSGCDTSPTEPNEPEAVRAITGAAAAQLTLSFVGLPNQMQEGTAITFSVKAAITGGDLPPQVALSTSLGTFGTDANGPTELTVSLTNGQASNIPFYAGTTAGQATVVAAFGNALASQKVTVTDAPVLFLQTVDPLVGPPTGGTTVTITGQGFASGARVSFGGALATGVVVIDAQTLTAVTPQSKSEVSTGSTLAVDVTVDVPAIGDTPTQTDTLPGAFSYTTGAGGGGPTTTPSVRNLTPTQGSNLGGYQVQILGTGFDPPNVEVRFGQGDAPESFSGTLVAINTSSSSTTSLVIDSLPAASSDQQGQTLDVLVRNTRSGLATVARNVFTYLSGNSVISMTPTSAPYTGKDANGDDIPVTIRTQNPDATPNLSVEFGGVFQSNCPSSDGTTCTVASDGTISLSKVAATTVSNCTPPSGSLIITDNDTGEVSAGPTFNYTAVTPGVNSLFPTSIEAQLITQDSTTTLTGAFDPSETTRVSFGGQQATLDSAPTASTITVQIPPFTGTFAEATCTVNGEQGTRKVPTTVDVEVLYPTTGCNDTLSQSFSYLPSDDESDCTVASSAPIASFSVRQGPSVISPPLSSFQVEVSDTSTGDPTSWRWDFGDGESVSCTSSDPSCTTTSHTYTTSGIYTITLQVSNSGGTDTATRSVSIPPLEASFTFSPSGLTVQFTDTSSGNPTAWTWDFGDNTTSIAQNPSHTYAAAGTYTVTLRVTDDIGGSSQTSANVTVAP